MNQKCSYCNQSCPRDHWGSTGTGIRSRKCKKARADEALRAKDRERWRHLRYKYNMTVEQYDSMLSAQEGVCAICSRPPLAGEWLCVDHDHSCCVYNGKSCGECNRGLLCRGCNTGIGALREDPRILLAAIEYLAAA